MAAEPRSYTLTELAAASGLPARTIRYYQSSGLLPKPARRGKQVHYDQSHLDLLSAISRMRGDGLRLSAIRDLLGRGRATDGSMIDLLGPEVAGAAWLAGAQRTFSEGELAEFLGDAYPEQVSELVKAGYLELRPAASGGPTQWFANSVPQLKGALELRKLGTDIALSGQAMRVMRKRIRRMCEEFVVMWISQAGQHYAGEATQEEFEANLEAFRSIAWQSAAHVTAVEMERAIQHTDRIKSRMRVESRNPQPG